MCNIWAIVISVMIAALVIAPINAEAKSKRSSTVRAKFLKSKGLTHTPRGCQVDHRISLTCGGSDTIDNLRLYCDEDMKWKERIERKCDSLELQEWLKWHP